MSDIYDEVADILADTGNVFFSTTRIDNAWYAAECQYVIRTKYLTKKGSVLSLSSGDLTVDLPEDCMKLLYLTIVIDGKERALEPSSEEKFDDDSGEWRDSTNQPMKYAVRPPNTVVFNHQADDDYDLYPYYVYQPSANTIPNIPLEHRDQLLNFVLWKGFSKKMEWATANRYRDLFDRWIRSLEPQGDRMVLHYPTIRDVRNEDYMGY